MMRSVVYGLPQVIVIKRRTSRLNLSEVMNLTIYPNSKIAKSTSDLLLTCQLGILIITEYISKHVLNNSNCIGLGYIALTKLANDRLISLQSRYQAILRFFRYFHARHAVPPFARPYAMFQNIC